MQTQPEQQFVTVRKPPSVPPVTLELSEFLRRMAGFLDHVKEKSRHSPGYIRDGLAELVAASRLYAGLYETRSGLCLIQHLVRCEGSDLVIGDPVFVEGGDTLDRYVFKQWLADGMIAEVVDPDTLVHSTFPKRQLLKERKL